jgi:hypothetical protein
VLRQLRRTLEEHARKDGELRPPREHAAAQRAAALNVLHDGHEAAHLSSVCVAAGGAEALID